MTLRKPRSLSKRTRREGVAPAESRTKLLELRAKRPRPHLDDKIITAWNGLMISAFARAAQVLDDPAYLEAATRAATFVRNELYDEKRKFWCVTIGRAEVRWKASPTTTRL